MQVFYIPGLIMAMEKKSGVPLRKVRLLINSILIFNNLNRAIAQKSRENISHLASLTEYALKTKSNKSWPYYVDVFEIRKLISSMCHIFAKQELHKTLNERQRNLAVHFQTLQKLLKESNIIRKTNESADVFPYWTILKQRLELGNSRGTVTCLQIAIL